MYDIAEQVRSWLAEGCDVHVATVVSTRGFSSREPVATAAWTPGGSAVGHLVAGLPVHRLPGTGLVEVTVGADDAAAAGLSCAGAATVLIQPAGAYPDEVWDRLPPPNPRLPGSPLLCCGG